MQRSSVSESGRSRGRQSRAPSPQPGDELRQLFVEQLADLYSAEQQLIRALPKMAKAAESDDLRNVFESHLEETEMHVTRLEEVANALDESIKRKSCAAMKGLIEEAQALLKEQKGSSALDAALIAAAQKVEHYEIASYGTLCAWAEQLGEDDAAETLSKTLEEEKSADEKLTKVGEESANQRAQEH